jgi:hypothetical protein
VLDPIVPDSEDVGDMAPVVRDATVDAEQLPADPLGCRCLLSCWYKFLSLYLWSHLNLFYNRWRAPVIRRDNPLRALIFYRDQLDQQTDDEVCLFSKC